MDDLVVTGALMLIGLYLAAVILLFVIFSFARLMFSSLVARHFWVVIDGIVGVVIILSIYMAIGFWLRNTDRI